LEEIYICTQLLKGFTYNDVLSMPTYERRFFLGMLTKQKAEEEERVAEMMNNQQGNPNAKGSRQTKVSGQALKNKFKTGEIPLT